MERLGIGRRNDAVALAPDDVGGDVHAMQPALQPRVEEARLPPETRAGNAVENGEILIFVGTGTRGGFLAELGIDIGEEIGRAHAELQSQSNLVCRLLLEKKKKTVRLQP